MGLCFHSSTYLPPSLPPQFGGKGLGDPTSDLEFPETNPSNEQYFSQHSRHPKAKHPHHPFKWSTRRLHTIHQKAHEHWLWSLNYYWSHHDPSKQAPLRIKPHQVRAIASSKAIGPKRAGIEPFARTWAKCNLVKRRRKDQQGHWNQLAEYALEDQECAAVQLPYEREGERSERRQLQRRPPSLEREDAFRDEESSKRRREMMIRRGRGFGGAPAPEMSLSVGEEYDLGDKIRVVGYEQALYDKQRYKAAVRGEIRWPQMVQTLEREETDMASLHERELVGLSQNRLRFDFRGRSSGKEQENISQQRDSLATAGWVLGVDDAHMREAPLLEDVHDISERGGGKDEEWEFLGRVELGF
ncbi:hypothetical protein QC761_704770 [Podospora bellae-mahoneyi]|uniref:Uncharacterized protein n=1 Tax=Podospora bellae-mahoneyi TaxID=2093777 RepID=A0ABR0F7X5_9PEZI|nr:hypothetical protein QC761_704770 [Podospora bellae-mahoneyi]